MGTCKDKRILLPLVLAVAACWCLSTAFVATKSPNATPAPGQVSSRSASAISMASAGEYTGFVPDMQRRTLMNLVCVICTGIPVIVLGGGYLYIFYPPIAPDTGAGVIAGDINGNPITLAAWNKTHKAGDRELVQGNKGDPTWIITEPEGKIKYFGIGAVCTHLGCTVPWNAGQNKYMCPCHGSQYNNEGKVIRGPAPLSLPLATTEVDKDGNIRVGVWKETDFRDGSAPWWV